MADRDAEKRFGTLIREHQRLIEKVCRVYVFTEEDRQDLFQEIVIQAWNAWPRFRGDSSPSTYLYRIALNTAIAGLRKHKRKEFIRTLEPGKLPHRADEDNAAQAEEQLGLLYRAVSQLNEVEKALVLLYLEDRSYREMESILGITEGALRVKMSRIKDKLRELTKQ